MARRKQRSVTAIAQVRGPWGPAGTVVSVAVGDHYLTNGVLVEEVANDGVLSSEDAEPVLTEHYLADEPPAKDG